MGIEEGDPDYEFITFPSESQVQAALTLLRTLLLWTTSSVQKRVHVHFQHILSFSRGQGFVVNLQTGNKNRNVWSEAKSRE